jgi:hypothetical protein
MHGPPSAVKMHKWVDAERGQVSRDIFVNDDICRLEMERIFDRTWVFLAHETEISCPGFWAARRSLSCGTATGPCMHS